MGRGDCIATSRTARRHLSDTVSELATWPCWQWWCLDGELTLCRHRACRFGEETAAIRWRWHGRARNGISVWERFGSKLGWAMQGWLGHLLSDGIVRHAKRDVAHSTVCTGAAEVALHVLLKCKLRLKKTATVRATWRKKRTCTLELGGPFVGEGLAAICWPVWA